MAKGLIKTRQWLRGGMFTALAATTMLTALPQTAFAQRWKDERGASQGPSRENPGRFRGAPSNPGPSARTERNSIPLRNYNPDRARGVERAPVSRAPAQVPQRPDRVVRGGEDRGRSGGWQNAQPSRPAGGWQRGDADNRWNRDGRTSGTDSRWNNDRSGWRDNANRGNNAWQRDRDNRWNGRDNDNRWNRGENNDRRWDRDRDGRWDRGDNYRWGRDRDRDDWRGDRRRWDRDWRRDNRYDWSSYRQRNRNVYRIGRYYAPYSSYSYRRIGIGFTLGSLFYSNRYWINDPWQYRLPEAYGPYRWVRYYDDALLVDIYSGEVVDTIYDFFW